jgi:hypothetical protein
LEDAVTVIKLAVMGDVGRPDGETGERSAGAKEPGEKRKALLVGWSRGGESRLPGSAACLPSKKRAGKSLADANANNRHNRKTLRVTRLA